MSGMPGGFDASNPFATGGSKMFDRQGMKALIQRAQRGDLQARNQLKQQGFFGQWGEEQYDPAGMQAGDYDTAINQWATQGGWANLNTNNTPSVQSNYSLASDATRNDPTMGGRAQDTEFTWNTNGGGSPGQVAGWMDYANAAPATSGPNNSPATTPPASNPAGGIAAGLANPNNYKIPAGWNAAGNKFSFNLPTQNWTSAGNMLYRFGYNEQRDGAKLPSAAGNETEFNRVYAWMNAVAKANGFSDIDKAPPDMQAFAMNYAVGRLKTDMTATGQWANSAFNGFDKQAAGGAAPGGPSDPRRQEPTYGPNTIPNQPGVGPGPMTTDPRGNGGTPPPTYTNPTTGATTQAGNSDPNTLRNIALASNPEAALGYVLRNLGLDPTRNSLYLGSIVDAIQPMVQSRQALNGLYGDRNAIDSAQTNLDELTGMFKGGGGFGALQQEARGLLGDSRFGSTMGDLGDQQAINAMQTILAQAYGGSNKLYQQARLNRFNRAYGPLGEFANYSLNNIGNPNVLHPVEWIKQSPWAAILSGY